MALLREHGHAVGHLITTSGLRDMREGCALLCVTFRILRETRSKKVIMIK